MNNIQLAGAMSLALVLAACGGGTPTNEATSERPKEAGHADEGVITLTADQIATAGVQIATPLVGGAGTIELPATIDGDPQATQVVSAAIAGRVVALNRNLGEGVSRGQTLAVIESREAAQLKGEVEASRARLALAKSNLAREQRLFAQRVSPEQDLIAARAAATEARIALTQAQSQVSAAGGGGGGLRERRCAREGGACREQETQTDSTCPHLQRLLKVGAAGVRARPTKDRRGS